jgi:LPXTG-motif cell wall-anchored protein
MSTGSPWGAFAGIPVLAGGLAGYFTGKKKAEDTTQAIKENNERINKILVDRYDYKASAINQNTVNGALLNLKAFGGNLHMNDIFNNGVRFIEEGGSHEQNPLGGVPQGIAPDG